MTEFNLFSSNPATALLVALVIFLGGLMQSTVGFAYALFATPLLVLLGVSLPSTIVIVGTCSLVQSIFGASCLRADVPWRTATVALILRMIAVAVGILWLKRLAAFPMDDIRLIVGALLCLLVAGQWLIRVQPVERLHPAWAGLAFTSSGLLAGLVGMGGPPLVLWAMAHTWSNEKTRGFLFSVFMISIPLQLMLLYFTFGIAVLKDFRTGLLLAPVVLLGARIGIPIGNRMSRNVLRQIAYGILLVIGLSAVLPRLAAMAH